MLSALSQVRSALYIVQNNTRRARKPHVPSCSEYDAVALQEKLDALGPNGRIHIEVRYLPFVPPDVQAEAMKKLERERLKANAKNQLRRRATTSTLDMRGVLTVNVHRCINLEVWAAACGAAAVAVEHPAMSQAGSNGSHHSLSPAFGGVSFSPTP